MSFICSFVRDRKSIALNFTIHCATFAYVYTISGQPKSFNLVLYNETELRYNIVLVNTCATSLADYRILPF